MTNKEKELFIAAQDAAILLDFKKEKLTQAHYYINHLFRVIAERKKVDFWNLIFLMETELEDFLRGKISEDMLKNRRRSCTYLCTDYNVYCLESSDTAHVLEYCLKAPAKELMEISGTCASPGNLIAKVRILESPKDISKVKHGEIIVTGMTTPEYLPAMKKAVAIVTDEGGITCHAAIVSRELGIPCVIGTKIATKVFKNGDVVEVDANNGVVRKLNGPY